MTAKESQELFAECSSKEWRSIVFFIPFTAKKRCF